MERGGGKRATFAQAPIGMVLMNLEGRIQQVNAAFCRLSGTAALVDKTRQLEAFCYTVAHDLRAPLRSIAGYADHLREECAGQLPGALLGYTRVRQAPLASEVVDLTGIAGRVAEHLQRENESTGLVVNLEAPLGRVQGDPMTIEHVLLNLLSNAVKFRREKVPPVIRIFSEQREGRLRLWVEDNGIGLDPRFKDRAFGMFERLHPELNIPGTGVGLAIVAAAMERLRGTFGVEPNLPAGSRFWIEFPQ